MAEMIDREYFTLVFKGDIGKFKLNPMNADTPYGRPVAAGRGNAFEEADKPRRCAKQKLRTGSLVSAANAPTPPPTNRDGNGRC